MKELRKIVGCILVLTMLLAMLSACGGNSSTADNAGPTEGPAPAAPAETDKEPPEDSGAEANDPEQDETPYFPLAEPETLSYWVSMRAEEASLLTNLADSPGWQYVAQKLNVDLDFRCASQMTAREQFNLMVAGEDYTDIISSIDYYAGGAPKAYEDEVIIDLKDGIEAWADNYRGLVESLSLARDVQTDEGLWLSFYMIYEDFKTLSGFTVRQDFLDELDMDAPVTYDDYEAYAGAVKVNYGISDPLLMTSATNSFVTGFNVTGFAASAENSGVDHLFQRDGVVTSSFLEPAYKEYLQLMNKWYAEGYISHDFYSHSDNVKAPDMEALLLNGQAGLYENSANEMAGHEEKSSVEGFALTGVGEPRKTPDDVIHVSDSKSKLQTMNAVCISTGCDNRELAFRFIDYFYTEEGLILSCYGLPELVTTDDTGMYVYTDEAVDTFTNNQWGTTYGNAQRLYKAMLAGRKTQNDMFLKWGEDGREAAAVELWNSDVFDDDYLLPSTLSLTREESQEVASLASEMATYASERIVGFITGDRSWDEYDAMVDTLVDMGLNDLIKIYQDAMDRYLRR